MRFGKAKDFPGKRKLLFGPPIRGVPCDDGALLWGGRVSLRDHASNCWRTEKRLKGLNPKETI